MWIRVLIPGVCCFWGYSSDTPLFWSRLAVDSCWSVDVCTQMEETSNQWYLFFYGLPLSLFRRFETLLFPYLCRGPTYPDIVTNAAFIPGCAQNASSLISPLSYWENQGIELNQRGQHIGISISAQECGRKFLKGYGGPGRLEFLVVADQLTHLLIW